MRTRLALPFLFAACAALCGCSCGGDGPSGGGGKDGGGPNFDLPGLVSIDLAPKNATLVIDGSATASQRYTVTGTFEDGRTEDVTAKTQLTVSDSSVGSIASGVFTSFSDKAGATRVLAKAGAQTAETGLTVVLRRTANDPLSKNLPVDPASKFAGNNVVTRKPDLVYPNNNTLVPPNLGKLEFHFLPGTSNTLFELAFKNDFTDVKVYLRCQQPFAGGCIYLPDAEVWRWIANANRGRNPLSVTLRGTDDTGTALGTSETIFISFSFDDITGGLYYWTTSNGTAIMRWDFASATQTAPEKYLDKTATGGTCVGCHALSRDGKKMVAEAGGQNDGRLLLLDVATKMPLVPFAQPIKSIFESWNPDGSKYVGVYGDTGATNYNLMIFNGSNGTLLESVDGSGSPTQPANHPDWSPDGTRIAFTRVGIKNTNQKMYKGAIHLVTAAATGWSPAEVVVPAASGKNRYYPAFSPDGSFLVFNESHCTGTAESGADCDGDVDPSARLFAVLPKAGATPVELAKANAPGIRDGMATDLTNSYPKWSPFVFQRTGELGTRLMWITFSSSRKYGLRTPPGTGTLLWMAAVDPDKVAAGMDPSYAAFCLPFQDLATSNHIAQWTTQVVPVIQ